MILALQLGAGMIFVVTRADVEMALTTLTIGVIFLAYALGGAKLRDKINQRFNKSPFSKSQDIDPKA